MALVSLLEVKEAYGLQPNETKKDSIILQEIPNAETAVQNFTHRKFQPIITGATVASAQDFDYEESGVITTDDFEHGSVTAVSVVDYAGGVTPLTALAWVPQPLPFEYPVGWWIEARPAVRNSPEMGFLQNMDVYAQDYGIPRPARLRVTAKWGWPGVPGDVKRAVVWTVISFIEQPKPYSSEAIAGYSRTATAPSDAIPDRAKDLLGFHVKT